MPTTAQPGMQPKRKCKTSRPLWKPSVAHWHLSPKDEGWVGGAAGAGRAGGGDDGGDGGEGAAAAEHSEKPRPG